jgi:hypothetical protein
VPGAAPADLTPDFGKRDPDDGVKRRDARVHLCPKVPAQALDRFGIGRDPFGNRPYL